MENPLKKLLDFKGLLGSLGQKETSAVGIDIGSSFIKVVQLRKKGGRAVLETYGELALGPYAGLEFGQMTNLPSEKISEALIDIIREANVTTKSAAISIPFSASLVSLIELPKVSEGQLDSIIPIEARKYIPVPIGEVSLDWWLIPKRDESGAEAADERGAQPANPTAEKIEVLIAAIHNDTIKKYEDIVKRVGLTEVFFEIEMFSTIRSTFGRDMQLVMVLDMGAGNTKLSIVEYGIVKGSHVIDRGSQDITVALSKSLSLSMKQSEEIKRKNGLLGKEGDPSVKETIELSTDYIFSEVNRVLLNYEKKYNKTIGKYVI